MPGKKYILTVGKNHGFIPKTFEIKGKKKKSVSDHCSFEGDKKPPEVTFRGYGGMEGNAKAY